MTTEVVEPAKELISLEGLTPADIFTAKGMMPIIKEIENKVAEFKPDLTTAKGRKEISSMAFKITKSKTLLDGAGKKLTEEARAQIKSVDGVRKVMRDRLDDLKSETRKPLDEWEQKEVQRVDAIQAEIDNITFWGNPAESADSHTVREALKYLSGYFVTEAVFQEFTQKAQEARDRGITMLNLRLKLVTDREEKEAELQKLRAQEIERDIQARKDAEELKQLRQDKIDAEAREAKAKQDAIDADERTKQAEADAKRKIELDKAEQERFKRVEAQRLKEREIKFANDEAEFNEKHQEAANAFHTYADIDLRRCDELVNVILAGSIPGITATFKRP